MYQMVTMDQQEFGLWILAALVVGMLVMAVVMIVRTPNDQPIDESEE